MSIENKHILRFRYEVRLAPLDVAADIYAKGSAHERYPCLSGCKENHTHCGTCTFIYARCECGWEEHVGDRIAENKALIEGRLRHMQHQIDALWVHAGLLVKPL